MREEKAGAAAVLRWRLGRVEVVDGAEEALGAEPRALDEGREVDTREDVLLDVVVEAVRHVLRAEDRRERL